MIEINHNLLSDEALDNLIMEVITRDGTDYGEYETAIETKKQQLIAQLKSGLAIIAYSDSENVCDIINIDNFKRIQTREPIFQSKQSK
ncbi:MAG: YheU family protein [Legionellaceae bacterium]|nr:YheU family protein [Legionellaceae bacterium]